MDHFILPNNPTPADYKVPYVCTEPYDGGDFLTYPDRKGKPWLASRWSNRRQARADPNLYDRSRRQIVQDQESFYQTWLFFGLLAATLGERYDAEDYMYSDGDCTYVTTQNLVVTLEKVFHTGVVAWGNHKPDTETKQEQYKTFANYLSEVSRALYLAEPEFDWRISLHSLSIRIVIHGDIYGLHSIGHSSEGFAPSEACLQDMPSRCNNWQTLFLLSRVDLSNLHRDHTACTSAVCEYFQSNLQTYVPKHRVQECKCHNFEVDSSAVQEVLDRGAIPLLKITCTANSVEVQVIELTPESEYVAISHVWAEGMGNPHANSLPTCQLAFLRKRVDALPLLRGSSRKEGPRLIWFDTLCCPIQPPEAKQLALSRMRETYYNSSGVLVLDAELQSFAYDHTCTGEAFARLLSCAWSHRLWTLQESILAPELFFQFENESISLRDMFYRLDLNAFCDLRSQCMTLTGYQNVLGISLRSMAHEVLPQQGLPSGDIGSDFSTLHQLLARRSPSVVADEALCISTMLRLPLEELVQVPNTVPDRMSKMWELVAKKYGGIPQHMLCLNCPKLDVKGFKWAPRSLLIKNTFQRGGKQSPWKDPKLGIISRNGLLIQCPGFLISTKQSRNGFQPTSLGLLWATHTHMDTFSLQGDGGVRYITFKQRKSGYNAEVPSQYEEPALYRLLDSGSCGLVLVRPLGYSKTEYMWDGIIGRVEESDNGGILNLAISTRVITLDVRASSLHTAMSDAAATLAQQLREDPITIAIEKAAMDLGAVIGELEMKIKSFSGVRNSRGAIRLLIDARNKSLQIGIPGMRENVDLRKVAAFGEEPEKDPIFQLLAHRFTDYWNLNEELKVRVDTKAEDTIALDEESAFLISGTEEGVVSFGEMILAHLHSYVGIRQNENQQWCVDG